jgi:hypothetical protein
VVKLRETPEAPGMRLQQLRPELLVLTLRPGSKFECVAETPKLPSLLNLFSLTKIHLLLRGRRALNFLPDWKGYPQD